MTEFDLELENDEILLSQLEELEGDWSDAPSFEVVNNAEYARPLEFGRGPIEAPEGSAIPIKTEDEGLIFRKRVGGHPPYPFFGPGVRQANRDLSGLVRDNSNTDIRETETIDELMFLITTSLNKQIKRNVRAGASGRSPGTDSQHPQVQTGNLLNSQRWQRI